MKQTRKVTTRFPDASDLEPASIERLSNLVNAVYDDAESGMFKQNGSRTSPAEIERLLRARALIMAEIDGVVVGTVSVRLVGEGVGEFGMLAADPANRGCGIGSALVERAEDWARRQGCRTMRLELLTPRHWIQPSKEFLKTWYSRIGYAPRTSEPQQAMYPHLVPLLATECDFTIWCKALT